MSKIKKKSEKPAEHIFEITKNMKCQLTTAELLVAADRLAEAIGRAVTLEEEKKSVVDSYKAKLSEAESQIGIQKNLIQNKFEFRPVACHEIYDYSKATIRIVRLDTDAIEETRAMTQEERQGQLDFDNKDKTDKFDDAN